MVKLKKTILGQCESTIYVPGFPQCTRDAYVRENGKLVCESHSAKNVRAAQEQHKKGVATRAYH